MVAEFQGVTHHSWHPLHDTIRMQIDIPATIVIAAPHDSRILEELAATHRTWHTSARIEIWLR